jgi:hypothetical protein
MIEYCRNRKTPFNYVKESSFQKPQITSNFKGSDAVRGWVRVDAGNEQNPHRSPT